MVNVPGWLYGVLALIVVGLGSVILLGLAVVMGSSSDRRPPTRRDRGRVNGDTPSDSDGPQGGA